MTNNNDKQKQKKVQVAPVVTDALAFAEWIVRTTNCRADTLSQRLVAAALELAEHIGFAWKDRDRAQRLMDADDAVLRLRILLRLCPAADTFSHKQMMCGLSQLEKIGRQIGGWMKSEQQSP